MSFKFLYLFISIIVLSVISFKYNGGYNHINLKIKTDNKNFLYMASGQVPYVPYYPNKASKDYQWMDIYNALGRDRTLFVGRYLDDEACNQLIASLIWY